MDKLPGTAEVNTDPFVKPVLDFTRFEFITALIAEMNG